ncbi:choice-of-anchor I family protein [Roseomonas sp. SSH11]|uniref:Choice-of-anchor I family protein n=1 Tax=Pararoseomonas baculiformis TaxID=2820812 RepID=A0ABS4AEL7_9PROT|nr:choice-of-anchor I family protein [Pararoseomonas baculiformis]MBP0445301.1 choice-of-anchor I family protein [Pararoseomonas baculiformis]
MPSINSGLLWTKDSSESAAGSAEVVAYDAQRGLVLVLGPTGVEALAIADGALRFSLPAADLGSLGTGNSVDVHGDIMAVAYDNAEAGGNGVVAFYRIAADGSGATLIRQVEVGAVPDMVTFTPDGSRLLVAIEGEPNDNYGVDASGDPVGGVAVIDVATGNSQFLGFEGFDTEALRAAGVRITGVDGITAATDLEPEYIALSEDGLTAYITLQENNAIAVLDLETMSYTGVYALGTKDHSIEGNGLDISDRDGGGNIVTAPIRGMYMPDGIATFSHQGKTYLVTANEGDATEWGDYGDTARVKDLNLDEEAFGGAAAIAALKADAVLGRLEVSAVDGDIDGDGDIDVIHALGGRSFSIWEVTETGLVQTFDSGDMIERMLLQERPDLFDDTRSDAKGPEPESITLGTIDGQLYAFVALERSDSVMSFAITSPTSAEYAGIIATEDAPEAILFVPAEDLPDGMNGPILLSPNEGSGITTAHELEVEAPASGHFTLQILHASDFEAGLAATTRAAQFAAIVDKLEDSYANSITLSSGDNFIPSPFGAAGTDPTVREELIDLYAWLLGVPAADLAGLTLSQGAIDIAIMNALGVQASVLGNHEFDYGTTALAAAIDFVKGGGSTSGAITSIGAMFPYLSSNLDFSGDSAMRNLFTELLRDAASYATTAEDIATPGGLNAEAADQQVAPWTTITEGGETIGVLGITTQILASISSVGGVRVKDPAGDGGVNNTDELAAVLQPLVDQMTAQGINKIILLSHLQQYQLELDLASKLSGVDVIVAGGSHAVFADGNEPLQPGDTASETYPVIVTGANGKPVAVVNTGSEYSYVGRLVVTFDENGDIITDSINQGVSGPVVVNEDTVSDLWGNEDAYAEGTRGGEVKAVTDAVAAVIQQKDGNVLGYTDVYLEGRRAEVRTEETNLGNLSADANLFVARQVDAAVTVSIKNGGGIRAEIGAVGTGAEAGELPPQANPAAGKPEGAVSQLDIENSLRFNNALSIVTVSAEHLVRIFEHAVAGVAPGATPGSFGQVGGVSFSYDAAATSQVLNADGSVQRAGERIQNLVILGEDGSVLDTIMRNGELVGDASRLIKMVTLSFMADGGDGYPIGRYAQDRIDLLNSDLLTDGAAGFAAKGSEQDALAEYLKAVHGTKETAFEQLDAGQATDERIQNVAVREDTVLGERQDGTDGADRLVGGDGRDALYGFAGDDRLVGGAGSDQMIGGAGNDAYYVDHVGDVVVELSGEGYDQVTASIDYVLGENVEKLILEGSAKLGTGNALDNRILAAEGGGTLYGLGGDDALVGRGGNDQLYGGLGNDRLVGDKGADTMAGGEGDDGYVVDDAGDVVIELAGEGYDRVTALIDYTLGANVEKLMLEGAARIGTGNELDNRILANELGSTLYGLGGNDALVGRGADDLLVGGSGLNRLTGGGGADRFRFDAFGAGNESRILDFAEGEDRIELDGAVFTAFGAAGQLSAASFGLGTEASTADQHLLYNAATGALYYDADGVGGAASIRIGHVAQGTALTAQDIWVV